MQEHHIKSAVRITALETILIHVAKVVFLTNGISAETLDSLREDAKKKLSTGGLPGMDPALSDHISAEYASEVDRLISEIQTALSNAWSQIAVLTGKA